MTKLSYFIYRMEEENGDLRRATLHAFRKIVKGGKITHANVMGHTIVLMETVEKIKGMRGEEKKLLVHDTIREYIRERGVEEGSIEDSVVEELIPATINLIVDVAKGQFNLKPIKRVGKWCCI